MDDDVIEIREQPIPRLDEACEWLSAAERYEGEPTDEGDIRAGLAASEALTTLMDVSPPYPLLREIYQPVRLAEALPSVLAALDRAAHEPSVGVGERLRIARAVRILMLDPRR